MTGKGNQETGEMFIQARSIDNPSRSHIVCWWADSEDFLFAFVTEKIRNDELFNVPCKSSARIKLPLVVSNHTYNKAADQWSTSLLPSGKKFGNIIVGEVELDK